MMLSLNTGLSFLAIAVAAAITVQPAVAATGCEQSARGMEKSCRAETNEKLYEKNANCAGMMTKEERKDCKDQGNRERKEAREYCAEQHRARLEACDMLAEGRYADPLVNPDIDFIDPDEIGSVFPSNPYVKLQVGHTHVLQAEDEIVVVHVTGQIREIQGVRCRVVADVVVEEEYDEDEAAWEYAAVEVTDDWFAQDTDNNVYYCGEVAQNFEDGVLRDLDGSFESGRDMAKGGILTLAMPAAGDIHRTEYALGEAEDIVQYLALNASPGADEGGETGSFPCEDNCLKTFDFAPLEPRSTEYKYYLPGIGFVLAVSLEDGEVDEDGREELVCTGDSLDLLMSEECGIEDPAQLLEDLCEYHNAFCQDDDEDDAS